MANSSLVGFYWLAVCFGIGVATFIWWRSDYPCTWYKVIALGGLGGTLGTVKGLVLVSLLVENEIITKESPFLVLLSSALFAAIAQYRYANE